MPDQQSSQLPSPIHEIASAGTYVGRTDPERVDLSLYNSSAFLRQEAIWKSSHLYLLAFDAASQTPSHGVVGKMLSCVYDAAYTYMLV